MNLVVARIKIRIASFIILILITSCHNKNVDIIYYKNSNLKYEEKYHFKNYDSIVIFYKNGKAFKTGTVDLKNNMTGKWNFYNIQGFLSDTREFFVIENESKLNQIWFFNKKKDTLIYPNPKFNVYNQKEFLDDKGSFSSVFIEVKCTPKNDTIKTFEKLDISIQDFTPYWSKNGSETYVVFGGKDNKNFNSNFSNIGRAGVDTIKCLYTIKENRKYESVINLKNTVNFSFQYSKPGRKTLRGYLVEIWKRKPTIDDSVRERKKTIYFEKNIYVK